MLLTRMIIHQKLPAMHSQLAKAWLVPRQLNRCLTRTIMCKSMPQFSNAKQFLTRLTHQRNNAVILVRSCFRYNKSEVTRDFLLYKHKSFWLFRLIGVFIIAQCGFWTYVLYNSIVAGSETRRIAQMKYPDGIPKELINWSSWQGINYKMSTGRWIYIVPLICSSAAGLILFGGLAYCHKNIHALVLKKGGEFVTFYKYGFFGRLSSFNVPLSSISAKHSRHAIRQHLPVEVKGHRFYYLIDKDGKYYNVRLFDSTVGVHRSL
ncbi:transmembrane protein 223-like [Amphiura filiformis]|uniref:transmembrane protein 223-like n=1 Tax=Amphiura filiformis TaxID=82378 RepID=UPI003B21A77C